MASPSPIVDDNDTESSTGDEGASSEILQAVHLLITEQPVVEGPLIVVELFVVEESLVVMDPSAAVELPMVEVLHQEQIP